MQESLEELGCVEAQQLIEEARKAAGQRKAFVKICVICGIHEWFARAYRPEVIFKEFGPFKALDGGSIYLCSVCLPDLKGAINR